MRTQPELVRGVAVFDLDGTLLRGGTVCEILARPLGRLDEMRCIEALSAEEEIARARAQMWKWYEGHSIRDLQAHLEGACWAAGAHEAVSRLHEAEIVVGIASITWAFAVSWFAERLDVPHWLGTDTSADGAIVHVWGRDKATWLRQLAARAGVGQERTAAVGDSIGDRDMLLAAGLPISVGSRPIVDGETAIHMPGADLRRVADHILAEWA